MTSSENVLVWLLLYHFHIKYLLNLKYGGSSVAKCFFEIVTRSFIQKPQKSGFVPTVNCDKHIQLLTRELFEAEGWGQQAETNKAD